MASRSSPTPNPPDSHSSHRVPECVSSCLPLLLVGFWGYRACSSVGLIHTRAGWSGWPVRESFGVVLVGVVEHGLAGGVDSLSVAGVTVRWCQEADPGVMVVVVVPVEESFAMRDRGGEGRELGGPVRPVLQRFEPWLRRGGCRSTFVGVRARGGSRACRTSR